MILLVKKNKFLPNKLSIILLVLIICFKGNSQVFYPSNGLYDYYKIVELKNPEITQRINIYPSIVSQYNKDSLIWNIWGDYFDPIDEKTNYFKLLPARFGTSFNTKYPRGYNDGAVWKGKGLTSVINGGFTGKYGKIKYTFSPVLYYSQNSSFDLASNPDASNPYGYQFSFYGRIDYVQRFGNNPFMKFNLGQSELRAVFDWFTFGASTENIIWGPAQQNPILLGNNSAGIPHIDLGSYYPIKTPVGNVELKFYWGVLPESKYFDDIKGNDTRYWTGASFGYSPSIIKGLNIGMNRVFYKNGNEFSPGDIFDTFWRFRPPKKRDPATKNDHYDQMGSITIRWSFPEVGFETYFEFAKNDFGGKLIASEPEHSRGYTIGINKLLEIGNENIFKLTYERSVLDRAKTALYRNHFSWYTHLVMTQGYTIEGQIIAGGIGPGSNTDYFEISYYFPKGRIDANMQRIRFDDDYFLNSVIDKERHDYEWTWIVNYLRIFGKNSIGVDAGFSYRKNMYYQKGNNLFNLSGGISLLRNF